MAIEHGVNGAARRDLDGVRQASQEPFSDLAECLRDAQKNIKPAVRGTDVTGTALPSGLTYGCCGL